VSQSGRWTVVLPRSRMLLRVAGRFRFTARHICASRVFASTSAMADCSSGPAMKRQRTDDATDGSPGVDSVHGVGDEAPSVASVNEAAVRVSIHCRCAWW
jgi:hypothetical protein